MHGRLYLKDLFRETLPLPPLAEQHCIAAGMERRLCVIDDS
jgi:hypothetical protein